MSTRQGRLFRKYAVLFGALVGGTLLASSLVSAYFSYQQSQLAYLDADQLEARRIAARLTKFVAEIEAVLQNNRHGHSYMYTATYPTRGPDLADRTRTFSYLMLRAEIAELRFLDSGGIEQVRRSRDLFLSTRGRDLVNEQTGHAIDRSFEPEFVEARSRTYFGPVYFASRARPQFHIAVADDHALGVTVATVDLKAAFESVTSTKVGDEGYAFVVDDGARLIGHPDVGSVLQDLSDQPHVRAAVQSTVEGTATGRNSAGRSVTSAFAKVPHTSWTVFVERPLGGPVPPLIWLWAAVGILTLSLAVAVGGSLILARRLTRPIETIRASAARIGAGALDQRIDIRTDDELQDLAEDFNEMAVRLRESHANLEQKVRDRTQDLAAALKELEAKGRQLEVASRHKSEFLANMSHELRTPLNAIIGFSDMLLEGMVGALNPKQEEYVRDILSSGRHQLSVINDILDLSKVEAGRLQLETAPFPLGPTISDAMAFVRERAAREGIRLALRIEPDVDLIDADERKVKQVIVNLLSNAVRFTPSGGRIDVTAHRENGIVNVAISDTGIGIEESDRDWIFEAFRQAGRQTERSREGTGLGLTLSKRIVELHGGRIWVDSRPGQGSTFSFELPVTRRAVEAVPLEN